MTYVEVVQTLTWATREPRAAAHLEQHSCEELGAGLPLGLWLSSELKEGEEWLFVSVSPRGHGGQPEPPWEQSVLGFRRPPTSFCWAEGGLAAIRGSGLLAAHSEPHLPLEGRRPGLLWEWRMWVGGGEGDRSAEEAVHVLAACICR